LPGSETCAPHHAWVRRAWAIRERMECRTTPGRTAGLLPQLATVLLRFAGVLDQLPRAVLK
jgi:hypothetical protein